MLHDVCLWGLGTAHFEDPRQLDLRSLVFFQQVHVCLLDELRRVAENFDAALHFGYGLSHIVQVGVRRLGAGLLATGLQAWQEKQCVLHLFEVKLELMSACIAHFLNLEQLAQELVCHCSDNFVEEEVLVD